MYPSYAIDMILISEVTFTKLQKFSIELLQQL